MIEKSDDDQKMMNHQRDQVSFGSRTDLSSAPFPGVLVPVISASDRQSLLHAPAMLQSPIICIYFFGCMFVHVNGYDVTSR